MAIKTVDLGAVSAYAVAVAHGFTGTEAEWEQYIANASSNALAAKGYAEAAQQSAQTASTAVAGIESKAEEALADIESAGTEKVAAVNAAGAAKVAAVNAAGDLNVAKQYDTFETLSNALTAAGTQAKTDVETAGSGYVSDIVSEGTIQKQAVAGTGLAQKQAVEAVALAKKQAIETAGTEQKTAVETAGSTQVAAVEAKGTEQKTAVEAAGSTQVAAVEAAGSAQKLVVEGEGATQKAAVTSEGATQVAAVQAKGTEHVQRVQQVIDSIPEDYTELTEEVSQVKGDLSDHDARIETLESLHHVKNMSLADIAKIVRAGVASRFFNIGDQIHSMWTDRTATGKPFDFVWDIVAMRDVELEDGSTVPGMVIQSHYATPYAIPFSNEAFYYAPDGLSAGTYHIEFGSTWGSKGCNAGAVYQFTLTHDVPAGGQLSGFYRLPDITPSDYRVYSWASASSTTPIETVTPVAGDSGTKLMTWYTIKSDDADTQNPMYNAVYGHNRYSQSAYRQYLNSDQIANAWWTPKNNFDRAPQGNGLTPSADYLNRHGFVAGFDDDFLSAIKPTRVQSACNTWGDNGVTDVTYDKFFLPSLEEIYCVPQAAGVEGEYWPYWKDRTNADAPQVTYATYPERITYAVENHASAQACRLRSASLVGRNVFSVSSFGGVPTNLASYAYRCAPACVIC